MSFICMASDCLSKSALTSDRVEAISSSIPGTATRLADILRNGIGLSTSALLDNIIAQVRDFGTAEQLDDATLIVAQRLGN
jgi:hypothetical protein